MVYERSMNASYFFSVFGRNGPNYAAPRAISALCPYPTIIAPTHSTATTRPTILQRAMVRAPPIAPIDVPEPAIRKAIMAPGLMPES